MAEKTRRFSPLTALGDGLLLLCALCGLAGSFLSLYANQEAAGWADVTLLARCAGDMGLIYLCAVPAALAALGVWSLPKHRGAAAAGLATPLVLWAWWKREEVLSGAAFTCKTITDLFAARVDWGQTFSYETGLTYLKAADNTRLFLLAALALLALFLGWAVVRARRWWLVLALTLPPLLPGLLADLYPDWPPFLALAACWCTMILCDLCRWAAPSARGKLTLTALPCAAAVLALITLAFPREGYTRPQWALDAEVSLHNAANRTSLFFSQWDGPFQGPGITYVGSAGEADLSRAGPLNYFGRTVLRVTAQRFEGLSFLRGSSLAVYENGVWKPLPAGAYDEYADTLEDGALSPLVFPASRSSASAELTVENIGAAGSCVYLPYYLKNQDWAALGMLPVEDAYFAHAAGQQTFTVEFDPQSWNLSGPGDGVLAPYRKFVYTHYLDVPDELRPVLTQFCETHHINSPHQEISNLMEQLAGIDPAADQEAAEAILDQIAATMADSYYYSMADSYSPSWAVTYDLALALGILCDYDPDTPVTPDGRDPVEYFLSESHRGYCMHYASAATLLLRSLGIPARYVSGFFADCVDGKTVDVPDRAAHAWVEVWVEGFGWSAVDVTPGAYDWYQEQQNGGPAGPAVPAGEPSLPPEESETPEPTPTPTPTPEPEATPAPSVAPQASGGGFQAPVKLLKALAAAAGAAALLWLGWYLPRKYREQRTNDPEPSRAGLACYGCLLRLERWGGRVSDRAVELAEKAKYSRQGLTDEEAGELRLLVDWEIRRLCAILPPAKLLLFGYLWGMPPGPENTENSAGNGD